ncbi:MAG: transcription antitermination factor NusB [Phycisphaerae bacterium]
MKVNHRARRLALQGLCCLDVQGPRSMEPVEQFIDDARDGLTITHTAKQLTRSAFEGRDACDEILARHARNWDVRRLAVVDRNILRLAVHELRLGTTPYKVVITEAVRLAKEFSTAESPRFVNGVLDAVARELRDADADKEQN